MATDSWRDKCCQIWTTTDESSFRVSYARILVKIFPADSRLIFGDFLARPGWGFLDRPAFHHTRSEKNLVRLESSSPEENNGYNRSP